MDLQWVLLVEISMSDSFFVFFVFLFQRSAASVASQWLELLHQDIRGRLAGIVLKSEVNAESCSHAWLLNVFFCLLLKL